MHFPVFGDALSASLTALFCHSVPIFVILKKLSHIVNMPGQTRAHNYMYVSVRQPVRFKLRTFPTTSTSVQADPQDCSVESDDGETTWQQRAAAIFCIDQETFLGAHVK